MYLLDIGNEWTVAKINDNEEKNFLEKIIKTFKNQETFFIGGNTDTAQDKLLDGCFGSDSGKVLAKVILLKKFMEYLEKIRIFMRLALIIHQNGIFSKSVLVLIINYFWVFQPKILLGKIDVLILSKLFSGWHP